MKSWTDKPSSLGECVAPPRLPAGGTGVRFRALAATLATCMVLFGFDALFPDVKRWDLPSWSRPEEVKEGKKPFEWAQISPSKNLKFYECFRDFECAKLSLPLDYFNGTYPDETISVAITKLPAKVSVDDPRYGGPILINPGGPGGPGALFTQLIGKALQTIVDAEAHFDTKHADLRYFDILGFDPRGIGETEPAAHCMSDPAAAWAWTLREETEGNLGSSDAALGRLWSMSHAWSASCKQPMDAEDGPNIKQYMATAFVARDMLEIVEKHATYVAETLDQLEAKRPRCHKPDIALYKPKEAKLQYWGFSYGTFLGSTFASMYPDRIGRAVLDGVVSSYDYNHSLGNGSLVDNQKSMDSFYTYCIATNCPFASANATLPDVKARVEQIVQTLYHNPLALNTPTGPEIFTYSDLKNIMFSACYTPRIVFPYLTMLLSDIEAGHGVTLDLISRGYSSSHVYSCPINGSSPIVDYPNSVPTYAVLCSDGIEQTHVTIEEFTAYWQLLESMSPTAGAIWSMLRMRCASWTIRAQYKFEGPFGGNTSHPILFLSNTADPVTPLKSGRIMHNLFPNSGLLVTDAAGHCSLSSSDVCTWMHVREYFQTGKLPKENTLCVPEQGPWSLNSTVPGSPFYDPSLGDLIVEEAVGVEMDKSAQKVIMAGWDIAEKIVQEDLFGVRRLVGGRGIGSEVMRIAAEGWTGDQE